MISEIDLRDWEKVDFKKLSKAFDELPLEEYNKPELWEFAKLMARFLDDVRAIHKKQVRQVAVLLKENND